MRRRVFLGVLATLAAWFPTRLRANENAVNASFKWPDPHPKTFFRLWDGNTLIEIRPTTPLLNLGRDLEIPVRVRGGNGFSSTLFRWRKAGDGANYDYVSGPKWWEKNILADVDNGDGFEATRRMCDSVGTMPFRGDR